MRLLGYFGQRQRVAAHLVELRGLFRHGCGERDCLGICRTGRLQVYRPSTQNPFPDWRGVCLRLPAWTDFWFGLCSPAAAEQQHAAQNDRADASPHRDVDGLLFLDRQLDRADLGLVTFLGVTEAAVCESKRAADDQNQCHYLDRVHCCLLMKISASEGARPVEPLAASLKCAG